MDQQCGDFVSDVVTIKFLSFSKNKSVTYMLLFHLLFLIFVMVKFSYVKLR